MNKIYEGVTRNQQAYSHTIAILMSMLRVWLEYGWSMARVWLKYASPTTRFLRPFSSKRAELERRLVGHEITTHSWRDYGSLMTRLRLTISMLLMLTLGSGSVWGQDDYSGTYYIGSDGNAAAVNSKNTTEDYTYSADTPSSNYYLVPASDPVQNNKNDAYFDGATGEKPFLTTYKTDHVKEALWVLTKVIDNDGTYYYIMHAETKKYVIYDPFFNDDNRRRRKCMHLDGTSPSEAGKFVIEERDGAFGVIPKSQVSATHKYWNLADKNRNSKHGLDKSDYYGGLLGLYQLVNNKKLDTNSRFKLEEVLDRPTFTSTSSQIEIGHSEGNKATIYYTIDGTNPTTTNCAGSGAAPLQIDMPENAVTLKAIAVKDNLPSCISSIRVVPNPTITLAANEYTYDGSAKEPTVSSVMDGETPIATSKYTVTYSGDNINVGTATVNIEDIEGDDWIVYGSTTFTINKKDLTITANNHTISYGDAPADNGVTCEGFVNSETIAVLEGTLEYAYNYERYGNVGNYTITPSGLTSTNYNITYHTGTLTVEQKEVGLTWSEPTSFVYDGASHGLTATATGMVNGDEIGVTVTGEQTNGGNHTATASALTGEKFGNYKLPAENSHPFTITPVALTITAKDHTITYGDAPAGNGVTYSGFIGTEDESVLGGLLDYDYSYVQYGDVGDTYTITPKGLTSTNYNITFTSGSLAVTPKTVGIDWTDIDFTYNGSEQVPNATATGMVNSDDIGITVTGAQTNAGNYTATASALTGNKKDNYKLPNGITQAFTISPKTIGDGNTAAEGITVEMTEDGSLSAVKDGSTTLVENTDYTQEAEEEGSDKIITITGKGNYTGIVKGIYASPQFDDPDGDGGPGQAAAVYMAKRDMSCPTGIKPYIIRKVNPSIGTVVITRLDYIPVDVPVLLLSDAVASGFVASPKDPSTPEVTAQTKNSNLLKVSAGGETVKAAQIYMFYKGEFVLTKAGTLGEGKFYLNNPNYADTPTNENSGSSNARGLLQFVIDDEEPTGITEFETSTTKKPDTDVWYTLDGRRLSVKPSKAGIYIHQGQKEYIKR